MDRTMLTFGLAVGAIIATALAPSLTPDVARSNFTPDQALSASAGHTIATTPSRVTLGVIDDHDANVALRGCGARHGQVSLERDGWFEIAPRTRPCTLRAVRTEGRLTARGPAVKVMPNAERVRVQAPDFRPAGIGIEIERERHQPYIHIDAVHPRSGAGISGQLEGGDVVLSIDGVSTANMSLNDFVDRAVGPAGTFLDLMVRDAEGTERHLRIERQFVW